MLTEMQRFVSVKIGCYDSATGWVVLNLLAPEGLRATGMARAGSNTEQKKKKGYTLYLLRNIPLWGKHITQSNIVTEINVKLQL